MDELSKAEKALADAQAIVDKLFADLGNAVPGTAKYGSVQTAYEKAKDNRDAKKKIYDPLKKASERAAKTETETATATEIKRCCSKPLMLKYLLWNVYINRQKKLIKPTQTIRIKPLIT